MRQVFALGIVIGEGATSLMRIEAVIGLVMTE